METMKNRVAVVTGAASGIGKALSLAFAAEGSSVVLADVEDEALAAAKAEVEALGVTALAVKTDVTDEESVADLCSATLEAFGEVHILCNNAGVGGGGLIKNQQLVDWKWVIDVSLWGVINGLHHFLPHLIEAEDSHVVSTASVAGLMAVPGLAPYNAAKYGVVAIMETLHHEMMRDEEANLGVSVLCPGVVRTNIATAQRNRPEHLRRQKGESGSNAAKAPEEARKRNSAIAAALENGMEPSDVASQVVNAIYDRRFWVLSHPELLGEINHRNQELAALKNPTLISDFT
jgi:NADP-dependent 3-hydroxy acid dehydrogenase YdfG|tara:strand:+ start:6326 stop:7195 length:870 start_codon:yes stop_codon:yes gene_type:complete